MIGVATNSYFTACFLRKIVDLLGGLINDPPWVVILLPFDHSSSPTWSWSGNHEWLFELTGCPSTWLVDSAPGLRTYKDIVRCIALGVDLMTLSKTSNANLFHGLAEKTPF